jgi:transposase
MKATGLKSVRIAKRLGINRRRIDKWHRLDTLPERNRMQPLPGMAESFCEYLHQRGEAGCRHGRTLLAEIRELGYVGGFTALAKLLSPWRRPPLVAATVSTQVKTIKRQMYGHAGVDLLRARLLPETAFTARDLHQT